MRRQLGRHPTMSKRKHALVLRLLTSDRSNTALQSWCQLYARSFDVRLWHNTDLGRGPT
jgi:hypothetical protein